MFKRIANYFGLVSIAGSVNDKLFVQQVVYRNKPAKSLMIFPYGMHASPKVNSFVQLFTNNNDPASRTGIAWDPKNRPKLADGDTCLYLPETNTIIKLVAKDGSIEVVSDSKVTVTSPDVEITGNVKITGNFEVNGSMTNNGKDVGDTHGHAQGNDSGGNTEAAISGVT